MEYPDLVPVRRDDWTMNLNPFTGTWEPRCKETLEGGQPCRRPIFADRSQFVDGPYGDMWLPRGAWFQFLDGQCPAHRTAVQA